MIPFVILVSIRKVTRRVAKRTKDVSDLLSVTAGSCADNQSAPVNDFPDKCQRALATQAASERAGDDHGSSAFCRRPTVYRLDASCNGGSKRRLRCRLRLRRRMYATSRYSVMSFDFEASRRGSVRWTNRWLESDAALCKGILSAWVHCEDEQ